MNKRYTCRKLFLISILIIALMSFFSIFSIPFIAQDQIIDLAKKSPVVGSLNSQVESLRRYDDYVDSYFCLYSNTLEYKTSSSYDVEHIFANSWVKDKPQSIRNAVYNDAFNVRVSDKKTNNARGNAYFDNVDKSKAEEILDSHGNIAGWLDYTNNKFEPNDDSKGDVARAILYMVVKYDLEYPYVLTMISWSKSDLPDSYEIDHYNTALKLCGYSNILIIKPTFARYCVW